jgi:molybdenum cofactor guanylyltransferase
MSRDGRVLGAIIAGGASRRFGSDKALAPISGRPILTHVLDALRPQVAEVVVCGRQWPDETTLIDLRPGRIGPLAGLEAALDYATRNDFEAVLSVPVDTLPLPADLLVRLRGDRPAAFDQQYLIGYWPSNCFDDLKSYISSGGRSMREWIREVGARAVVEPQSIRNVNFPRDMDELGTIIC